MKYFIALIVILGIIGIGIFGFFIMNHDMNHSSGNCVASIINNTVCPSDAISAILHHITAYEIFSQAIVNSTSFVIIATLLLLAIVVMLMVKMFLLTPLILFSEFLVWRRDEHSATNQRKLIRWLSLLKNSPAIN